MLKDVLQKFEALSGEKKKFLSSSGVLAVVEELEKRYRLKLALALMEIAVDENKQKNLADFLEKKLSLDKDKSTELAKELDDKIFKEFKNIGLKIEAKKELEEAREKIAEKKKESGDDIIFDKGDEKEIRGLEGKSEELKSVVPEPINWSVEADDILRKLKIDLADLTLNNRLKNIIISAIKGVRNPIDTQDALSRRAFDGGVGLSGDMVRIILAAIRNKRMELDEFEKNGRRPEVQAPKIQKTKKPVFAKASAGRPVFIPPSRTSTSAKAPADKTADKPKILMPPPPAIKTPKVAPSPPLVRREAKPLSKKEISVPLPVKAVPIKEHVTMEGGEITPSVPEMVKSRETKIPGMETKKKEKKKKTGLLRGLFGKKPAQGGSAFGGKEEAGAKKAMPTRQAGPPAGGKKPFGKIKMEDIKRVELPKEEEPHKLIGPVEEIEGLTIDDFRAWSKDPVKSATKIEEKINNLAKESLGQKILGVKKWRKSEIYKFYLETLNSAVIKNKPVEEIIKELKKERKPTISKEEFDAIADLSNKLRF